MNRDRYIWVTLIPLVFLLVVTVTAGWEKIFSKVAGGFAPAIATLRQQLAVSNPTDMTKLSAQIFNNQVDIAVTVTFLIMVILIVGASLHLWIRLFTGKAPRHLCEDPASPHPDLTVLDG